MSETRTVELGDALYHLRTRISQNLDSMVSVTVNRRDLETLIESADHPSAGVLSESDAVRREREAYKSGVIAWIEHPSSLADLEGKAAKRYPLPQISRPLRVTLSGGAVFSHEPRGANDSCPFRKWDFAQDWRYSVMGVSAFIKSGADLAALAHIQTGETELVDADAR